MLPNYCSVWIIGQTCWTKVTVWTQYISTSLKLFDSVPHERLLEKAKVYGIRGDILEWIRLFIKGRRQRVVVNGKKSSRRDVIPGVPPGSVIGPLLFLLFINDIRNEIKCNIQLFADDAKIFKTVKNEEDHQDLAKDLDNLENWERLWQMRFNQGWEKS